MKMIKLFSSLTAVAALATVAMPASAATINLSGVGSAQTNAQSAPVDQLAVAANINVGSQVSSVVDNAATAVNNVAATSVDVAQEASGLISGNGSLVSTAQLNASTAPVDQVAVALNGAGALGLSSITNAALAGNNVASVDVKVVQK